LPNEFLAGKSWSISSTNLNRLRQQKLFTDVAPSSSKVASWFLFNTDIPIWANFGGGKMLIYFMTIWNILRTFGLFMTIWYILCSFGTFCPVLVSCTKKNLATLPSSSRVIRAQKILKEGACLIPGMDCVSPLLHLRVIRTPKITIYMYSGVESITKK
jgi:hypothetical protein